MAIRWLAGLLVAMASATIAGAAVVEGSVKRAVLPQFERVMVPPEPKVIADFELIDQNGRPFKFSALRGQPALLFFGFANCPDVCPTTLQKLRMLHSSGNAEMRKVPVVMISVDGSRDTPALLKKYLRKFSPDFIGLTGDTGKVRNIAAQFSAVFFRGSPADTAENYRIQHTSQVYAVDKSGLLRAEFYDASVEAIEGVTGTLIKE
jgi:cytochrome oxidase Cu insertion factor (SCO1/SenC/PrrC family)